MEKKTYSDITILIDIDDTIQNFCETWVECLNDEYKTSVKYEEISDWDMCRFFPTLTKEEVYAPTYNPEFWDYVKPKPGAVEYVKKLIDEGYNVYLCTATYYQSVRPKFERIIQKHFPYINWNQVIVANQKQMIKADFLIDDGIHNLEDGDYIKILVSAPHNQLYNAEENGMIRADNWEFIYNKIIELSDKMIGEQ